MKISCTVNGTPRLFHAEPHEDVQHLLKREGYISVRDSDDAEGFAGSDTILLDGILSMRSFFRSGRSRAVRSVLPNPYSADGS